MRSVWKFEANALVVAGKQEIIMPKGAELLDVQYQQMHSVFQGGTTTENICIWAMVDTKEEEFKNRQFEMYGTGHDIPETGEGTLHYISTVQDAPLVWHVFERI